MNDLDEILQTQLAALEGGEPLEKVLADLPPQASELAPLLRLAAASRDLPHPQLSPTAARVQKLKVMAAAKVGKIYRTLSSVWPANRRLSYSLAGGLALLALVMVFALGASLYLAGPASAHYAQLANVNGLVEVASSTDGNNWHFVTAGEQIRQGQRIHTYADSSVTLAYFDGTRTAIGPDSDLTLTTLNGGWGNALEVQLTQQTGTTTNNVVPLRGSGSFFLVDTPSGQASVHGTSFDVDVNSDGEALFAVTHGKVQVKNAKSQVFLTSGQATSVLPGQNPDEPGYQFTLNGAVEAIQGDQWTVAGVQLAVTPQTEILGTPQVGDTVLVKGRILAPGQWVADSIEPAEQDKRTSSFTGVIETMPGVPGTWQISGQAVLVTAETELDEGLKVGSPVEVSFSVLPDGGWLAKEIKALEDQNEEPTSTPSAGTSTPTPESTDTLTPEPETTGTPTPEVTGTPGTATPTMEPTPTVAPKNDSARCDNRTQQQPKGLSLAQAYNVTYAEIMGWFCKGFGFGEIDLAYSLSQKTGMPVSDIFAMRIAGQGWGQIKQEVSAQATPVATPSGPGKGKNSDNNKKK